MVLCKYFQQGNCRFGTKCSNEHFDVKQIIKTDVESAINGNQWPLSCFGPFKDKPCIPNFIEDQSFEEIRFLCYESRQKNFFEQFHQQFSKEALEAKNKLKSLLQLTPEVVDLVSKLYDSPVDSTSGGAKTNNPFGMTGDSGAVASGNSIFGKTAAAPTAAGNVFSGGSSFGAVSTNNVGGMFGNNSSGPTAAVGSGGGLFGAALNSSFGAMPIQQTSIFAQPAKSTNSIFGGGAQQATIFGQNQQTAVQSVGLYAQAANEQQAATGGGLFAQAAQQQQQSELGLFAQAAQQTVPAFTQQPMFGQQQQNAGGMFTQSAQQQQAAGGNLFSQPQQQQQQQQQMQTQANATGGSIFAVAAAQTQNIFAQQAQQPANSFAQAAQQTQLPPPPPPATPAGGLFQQQAFMQQNQQATAATPAAVSVNSSIYSRMEDLTSEEIEAFKAARFTMGKIPFSPPPREIVN